MSLKAEKTIGQVPKRSYTMGEEIVHSVTHGIGTCLSIVGLILLVDLAIKYGDVIQIVSFSIYGGTLIILYLASTLYHGFQHARVKRIFRVIDHSSVYLLIAGSYTPFLLVGLQGTWGWILLAVIWGAAIAGIGFKVLFLERFNNLSTWTYLLMGWASVVMIKDLFEKIPLGGIIWLALGGAAYSGGVIFYRMKKTPYMHAIWHFFVLGGSICHFLAVLLYLAPVQ